jgi:hypothetical protein
MVYRLSKNNSEKDPVKWYLEPDEYKFSLPPKIYGDIEKNAIRIWNKFAKSKEGIGSVLIGNKGSGKTETAKIVGNIAIEHGVPVILVSEVTYNDELIRYISNLRDVVILFDEFGKIFPQYTQDKMFTMFNNLNGYKKLYLITENSRYALSSLFEDRPGRAWYWITYDRVPEDVVIEYCRDNNVSETFLNDLLQVYKKATKFNFDQLKSVVEEHLDYPDLPLSELISILNVISLRHEITYTISKVYNIMTGEVYEVSERSNHRNGISKRELIDEKRMFAIDIIIPDENSENKQPQPFIGNNTNKHNGQIEFITLKAKEIISIDSSATPETVVISTLTNNNKKVNVILTDSDR